MFGALFRRDPTRKFKRTLSPPLTWDTRTHSVNDIAIGEPIETLAPFGPASIHNSDSRSHHYLEYADFGMMVVAMDGRTSTMTFPVIATDGFSKDPNFKPANIRIRPEGLTVTGRTIEADVTHLYGTPRERDVDEEGVSLQFERGAMTYEFDFAVDGTLQTFTVYKDD